MTCSSQSTVLPSSCLLDGDVGHGRGGRGAVPVLFSGRKPDDVAGTDLLDGPAPALGAAAAGGDDEGLAERMGVPGGARAGLEGDAGADDARGIGRLKQRIDADRAGEVICRALAGWLMVPIRLISTCQ